MHPATRLPFLPLILCLLYSINTFSASPPAPRNKTTVTYRWLENHQIKADLYRSADSTIRPVIVWIHGGALIMGHREQIHREIRSLATEKNYALLSIDYRLAPETKLPDLISDLEAAFQWIADEGAWQFHLDPQRVIVAGGSAGGYLTLVSGHRAHPKPRALVALYGYGDLTGDWYSQPSPHPRHNRIKVTAPQAAAQSDGSIISDARNRQGNGGLIYLHYRQQGIWPEKVSGFPPETIQNQIVPFEPVRNVTPDYPPTLLIHGTQDTDVPYEQSVLMAEQFRTHKVPHQLISLTNAEHGFGGADPDDLKSAYQRMKAFIIKHLEPKETR